MVELEQKLSEQWRSWLTSLSRSSVSPADSVRQSDVDDLVAVYASYAETESCYSSTRYMADRGIWSDGCWHKSVV